MSAVIDQLHQDHAHIARLLDFVDAEVAKAGGEEPPDLYLLRDVMHYMTQYPDRYHHPKEDRIFGLLREHAGVDGADVDAVLGQHERLSQSGLAFLEAVEALLRDRGMLVSVFKELAAAYSAMQRAHLNLEEATLFKLARERLTDAEWAAVDAEFAVEADPLFGDGIRGGYEHLERALRYA